MNKSIYVLVPEDNTYVPYIGVRDGTLVGMLVVLWHVIEDVLHLNSTYIKNVAEDEEYIVSHNLTGNILYLIPCSNLYEQNIRYSEQISTESYSLIYKQVLDEYSSTSYINNLSVQLWFTLTLSFVGLTLFLYCMNNFRRDLDVDTSTCVLEQISILSCQGSTLRPKVSSVRILTITTLLLSWLIYCYYSTFLLTQLTSKKNLHPFDNVEDFLKNPGQNYVCGETDNSISKAMFTGSIYSDELLPKWRGLVQLRDCKLKEKICDGELIYFDMTTLSNLFRKILKSNCTTDIMKQVYVKTSIYLGLRSNFNKNILSDINLTIRKLKESGLITMWKGFFTTKINRENTQTNLITDIEFRHIRGVLLFYVYMTLLSVMILLVEIVWSRKKGCLRMPIGLPSTWT